MGAIEKREEQPIVTPAEAHRVLEVMKAFDYFKAHVLTMRDVVQIQGKPFVKKSGWSKYALACDVSTEVRDERAEERDGTRIYHFTYRAVNLPSGRFAEAVGSASKREISRRRKIPEEEVSEHDVRTLAQTRAFNRAISNLVGGGEISAEEMGGSVWPTRKRVPSRQAPPPRRPPTKPGAHGLEPGKVNLNVIEYNLRAAGVDVDTTVDIVENAAGFSIEPKRELGDKEWYKIDGTLKTMGGAWKQRGLLGLWILRKEAP